MLNSFKLPKSLWMKALKTTVYILNQVPTKAIPEMSFELWKILKLSLLHIRVWECPSEVKVYNLQKKEKRDLRSISEYFVGYAKSTKWYIFTV